MALPFARLFAGASPNAYRRIVSLTRMGLSSRSIQTRLIDLKLGSLSRGRTILPVMRYVKAAEQAASRIRFVGHLRNINTAKLPYAVTKLKTRFSFTLRVTMRDRLGKQTTRLLTQGWNKRTVTPQNIISEFRRHMEESQRRDPQRYDFELVEVVLVRGVQRDNELFS